MTRTIRGTYGSHYTPCEVYVCDGWYAVEDSRNVNHTDPSLLVDGVDVETLPDNDFFTADRPIEDEDHLEAEVDDYLNG